MTQEELLVKWKVLVDACKSYYIDSVPTGMLDSEYDDMERQAANEGLFVRDYVFNTFMQGKRAKNQYIEKIKKTKVEGMSMLDALTKFQSEYGKKIYCDLKYDGSSIAIYLDSTTGKVRDIVTTGNLNIEDCGISQMGKLIGFMPDCFPKGIVAIQCEALVDINRMSGDSTSKERARQKANSLITSKYLADEVNQLLTLRAYRYYTDDSPNGIAIRGMDYRDVLKSFPIVRSRIDGHFKFVPADSWTIEELQNKPEGFTETDCTMTSTGLFQNDGWVMYSEKGECLGALKYAGAGSGSERIITTIKGIQWNNQVPKGKDSWSANVMIEPVTVRGCTIKKPSAGSVDKLVKENRTAGAEVTIILANSTIPQIGETLKPGNGDFQWPTCSCGHIMSEKDVFGSLLKCSNPDCSERKDRMRKYLDSLSSPSEIDLNKFLVIDRFKWETTDVNLTKLLDFVKKEDPDSYKEYLMSFMGTSLRKRNMEVVWKASYTVLHEKFTGYQN
jgi:hypothetical protein